MIEHSLEYIVKVVELVGVAILLFGFAESLILFVRARFRARENLAFFGEMTKVRCRLGTYLLLGLEFMIASDIIMTIISPSQEELILVATLVAIRSAIGYFLES